MPIVKSKPFFGNTDKEFDRVAKEARHNGLYEVGSHHNGCEGCTHSLIGGWPTGVSCSRKWFADGFYVVVPANYKCDQFRSKHFI